ncbi:DUF1275 family protein [Streptomyces sp. JCM17656]|nr:DUF1275 family protein [Streptomyces sp. JCM17656]
MTIMTGNMVLLALAIADSHWSAALAFLTSLVFFLLGAVIAARIATRIGARLRIVAVLAGMEATLISGAMAAYFAGASNHMIIALLATAMGVQNSVVHKLRVPDMTTTLITRAIVGVASDSFDAAVRRRLLSIGVLFIGALLGGLLEIRCSLAVVLISVAVLLALTAVLAHTAPPVD